MTDDAHQPNLPLDELYWHTDLPVGTIAARVDLPARRLHARVTPLDAGTTCYRCHEPLSYASRAERSAWRLHCRHCGTSRRNPLSRTGPRDAGRPAAPVGGTILVRDHGDIGLPIDACIDALAGAGLAWDHRSLVVVGGGATDGSDAVDALRASGPGTLAVASLGDLAATQTERLQALFLLTTMRWRVVAANDIEGRGRERFANHYLEDLDEPIYPHWPSGPTHADQLVELTMAPSRLRRPW